LSIPGIEIHRSYDEYGPIRVFEEGTRRYLAFGEESQQSCVDLLNPAILTYEYTQAMMMALLYAPKPMSATLLGLGAGSLIHSLHKYDANIQINVAELRAKVIEVAEQWFGLEPSLSVNMEVSDACAYMASNPTKSDLIFSDIYNDDGMIESQLSPDFINDCYQNLNQEGVLVLNLWDQGSGTHPKAIQIIRDHFSDSCMTCQIEDGNLIAFAFKGGLPQINNRRLQPMAKKLSKSLSIPASKLLQRFRVA